MELIVVIAMGLVIAAVAIPNMMTGIASYRLRSGMGSLSGLIQNARMTAVQKNQTMSIRFTIMANGPVAYTKLASDAGAINSNDPQVQLGAPVSQMTVPSGANAPTQLTSSTLGFSPLTYNPGTYLPAFNARGLPCQYASGACTAGVGFVFYFTDTRPLGKNGWAAVTVSPAGRAKAWSWDGNNWH